MLSERLDIADRGDVRCRALKSSEEDYKMIETLSIQNFRCFELIKLNDLQRINIIVGQNASGKTALLEALFLAAGGSPEVGLRLKMWRIVGESIEVRADRTAFEGLWRDMFFGLDEARDIVISISGSGKSTRSVRVFFSSKSSAISIPVGKQKKPAVRIFPIVFETMDETGKKSRLEVIMDEQKITVPGVEQPSLKAAFFPSGIRANPGEAAGRFSALSKIKKDVELVRRLQELFPFIEGLSVETYGAGVTIFASVQGVAEKLPVGLVSEGIGKVLNILLAIANSPKGVVIVDEVENGFYFKAMPDIWRALYEFAVEYDVQLFLSTHSEECLLALAEFAKDKADQFSLLQTSNAGGKCEVRHVSGTDFEAALQEGVEVR